MKKNLIIASLLLGVSLSADGAKIYEQKCASCHDYFVPVKDLMENFMQTKNEKLKLKGPTLNQLNFRLKQMIGDPNGDLEMHELEVVEFVKDYVFYPDKAKSVCMEEVIEHFETMPSMKGKISLEELEEVGMWIYHYKQPEERK